MSEYLNPRSWDWENWDSWDDFSSVDEDIQVEQEERQKVLEAKKTAAVEEENKTRKRAEVLAALSTSGYSPSGTNTARSFLTSL